MVIESSALIAIVLGEPERRPFINAIIIADARLVAAPTMFEASVVALSKTGESDYGFYVTSGLAVRCIPSRSAPNTAI